MQNGFPHRALVMEWLGKAEDLDNVPDDYLKNSDEFPKLDIILATEMFENAKQDATSLQS